MDIFCESMLETVSTRISLGIEKRGHLQKNVRYFQTQSCRYTNRRVYQENCDFSVTFQLGRPTRS